MLMLMLTPDQIRQLRLKLGWTRPQMAKRIGVGVQAVYQWEKGITHPRYESLEKLNKLLKEAEGRGLVLAQ